MTDITNLKTKLYYETATINNINTETANIAEVGPSFLSVTNRYDFSKLKGVVYAEPQSRTAITDEIEKAQNEEDKITEIIRENTANSTDIINSSSIYNTTKTFTAKNIGFESYVEEKALNSTTQNKNLKKTTNTSKLYSNLQYSSKYNKTTQEKILKGGISTLINWLDDYINNYDARLAEGKARGDSEVKLSFLLRIRKAIENCDFPVGFGNDKYFEDNSDETGVVLGAFSNQYYDNYYLNPEDNTNDAMGATPYLNKSLILNAGVYCIDRKYTSQDAVVKAINNGESVSLIDVYMSSDEFYYNYASAYLASVLAHELIHSTHITNEAVTYNTCETIEDDFRNQVVSTNWTDALKAIATANGIDLSSMTYGDAYLPTSGGGGLGFHDLGDIDSVASHGHDENMAYEDYYSASTGKTLEDDKKELLNFYV